MHPLFKTTLSAGLLALSLSAHAAKTNIDFDNFDLHGEDNLSIYNGYAGLNWNNFGVVKGGGDSFAGTGYDYGTVTGMNAAFNQRGDDASFSSASTFNLYTMFLTAAWTPGTVEFYGYHGNTLTQQMVVNTSPTSPVLVHFNWSGIDQVRMHVQGFQFGRQQVIDNLKLEFTAAPPAPLPVPEPETYAMLLAGLGLVGYAKRRKVASRV
ncbi:PEP-CTERM sorting domain-containing protein [Rugamonas brunnea]|uniref:PEP-CTERM sorting domain-containing protein n=1 Tax=Rugamonas brunnea TaxID=2758569 RepID=UPI001E5F319F|nr:PEP-CTERM sorting domain-containing protein [Rugamonas brunnea]